MRTAPLTVPKIRVRTATGTRQRSSPARSGVPVVTERSPAVAVTSAERCASANGSRPIRCRAASVSWARMVAQSPDDHASA